MLRKADNTTPRVSLTLQCVKIASAIAFVAIMVAVLVSGFVPVHDDLGAYHLPLRAFYQQCLVQGQNWDWCPALFGGYFVHGEGQIGGDHPLHQILYRFLPLSTAFTVEVLITYPLLISGIYFWLRRLGIERKNVVFVAISTGLCGFATLRIVHPNAMQVIAHLPWLLGCLVGLQQTTNRKTRYWFFAASALLTGSQLLLGYPQYVLYSLIAELLMCFWLHREAPATSRLVAPQWIAAKLSGLLLGAAQVWPTLEYLSASERAGASWETTSALEGSWHPLNVIQYFAPYLFITRVVGRNSHELSCYLGAIPLIMVAIGIVSAQLSKNYQSLRRLGWSLVISGILISLGEYGPLKNLIAMLPFINKLRFPCRAMILTEIGLAIFSAIGLWRVANARNAITTRERRAILFIPVASVILTLIADVVWREWTSTITWQLAGLTIFALGAVAVFCFSKSGKRMMPALTILVIADLGFYAATMPNWSDWKNISNETPIFAKFWSDPEIVVPYAGWRERIAFHAGQAPTHIANRLIWEPTTFNNEPVANLNGYAGVKPRKDFGDKTQLVGVSKLFMDDHSSKVVTNVFPRVGLIDLKITNDQEVHFDWNADISPQKLTRDLPGRLICRVDQDQPLDSEKTRIVVTTESWHKDWIARVDGQIVPTVRINGLAIGCRAPNNAQAVEFHFESASHKLGRTISLCALSLLCLYGAGNYFSARTSLRKENDGRYVS